MKTKTLYTALDNAWVTVDKLRRKDNRWAVLEIEIANFLDEVFSELIKGGNDGLQ